MKEEKNIESLEDFKKFKKQQIAVKKEKREKKLANKRKKIEIYKYIANISRLSSNKRTFEILKRIEIKKLEQKAQRKIDFGEKSIKDFMSTPKSVDQSK